MIIYPAIDLKDGSCVRLYQGDMAKATVFSNSPRLQAKTFEDAGFKWIHMVDLNGAFEGRPVNSDAVRDILNTINIPIQLGGGIRDIETIAMWLDLGVSRIILGTAALKNPELIKTSAKQYPGKIAVGIDAKDGYVATEGWADVSEISAIDLAKKFEDAGVSTIIYTDISRDGTLTGANIDETLKLAENINIPVILSGGISSMDDIKEAMKFQSSGITGIITGRAIYDGRIDIHKLARCC